MNAAIACLESYLSVLETNEPINRAEGNVEQADMELHAAAEVSAAILELGEVEQRQSSFPSLPRNGIGSYLIIDRQYRVFRSAFISGYVMTQARKGNLSILHPWTMEGINLDGTWSHIQWLPDDFTIDEDGEGK